MKLRSFQPDGKPKTEAFKNLSFLIKDVKFLWNVKIYMLHFMKNMEIYCMNYEEEIIVEIASKEDCSLDRAKKIIKDLPLKFFLENFSDSCVLYKIIRNSKENLLAAFHNKFFNAVNWDTPVISGRKESKKLGDILMDYYEYSKGSGIKSFSLFLNDINFIGNGKKILLKQAKDIYVEKGKPQNYRGLIQKMVRYNDTNFLLSFLSYFKHYDDMIKVLMTTKFNDLETCKNITAFLEIPFDKIIEKIDVPANSLCEFDDLKEKNYKNVITERPEILIENMHSIEIIEYIYSLLNDEQKEKLLINIQESSLKKGNFRLNKYDVKSKGYTMISAIKNDCVDFIKFMLKEGYELNDFEKVEIKKQGFQNELPDFEDNLVIELNEKTKNDSDEKKFALALKYFADKKIIHEDFLNFIENNVNMANLSIDRNNLSFNNKFTAINIQKNYQSNNYSAVDALINLGFFRPLFKMDLRTLTVFQKEFIKITLINKVLDCHMENDYEKTKVMVEEICKIEYKKIKEEISDNFITEIYKRIFEKQDIPNLMIEEVLSSAITPEELESNKSFLLGYSYSMFERYTGDNIGVPSDNEIAHLHKCIYRNINDILYRFNRREQRIEEVTSKFNILMENIQKNACVTPQVLEKIIELFEDDEQVRSRIFSIMEYKKIESVLPEKVNKTTAKKRL